MKMLLAMMICVRRVQTWFSNLTYFDRLDRIFRLVGEELLATHNRSESTEVVLTTVGVQCPQERVQIEWLSLRKCKRTQAKKL